MFAELGLNSANPEFGMLSFDLLADKLHVFDPLTKQNAYPASKHVEGGTKVTRLKREGGMKVLT